MPLKAFILSQIMARNGNLVSTLMEKNIQKISITLGFLFNSLFSLSWKASQIYCGAFFLSLQKIKLWL
jgi:hypothetical protein